MGRVFDHVFHPVFHPVFDHMNKDIHRSGSDRGAGIRTSNYAPGLYASETTLTTSTKLTTGLYAAGLEAIGALLCSETELMTIWAATSASGEVAERNGHFRRTKGPKVPLCRRFRGDWSTPMLRDGVDEAHHAHHRCHGGSRALLDLGFVIYTPDNLYAAI